MYYYNNDVGKEKMDALENALNEAIENGVAEGREILMGTDGNDWWKSDGKRARTGLSNVAAICGKEEETTRERILKDGKKEESTIDGIMATQGLLNKHPPKMWIWRKVTKDTEGDRELSDHFPLTVDLWRWDPRKGYPTYNEEKVKIPSGEEIRKFEEEEKQREDEGDDTSERERRAKERSAEMNEALDKIQKFRDAVETGIDGWGSFEELANGMMKEAATIFGVRKTTLTPMVYEKKAIKQLRRRWVLSGKKDEKAKEKLDELLEEKRRQDEERLEKILKGKRRHWNRARLQPDLKSPLLCVAQKNEKGDIVDVAYEPEIVKEGWRDVMKNLSEKKIDINEVGVESNYEVKVGGIMVEVSVNDVHKVMNSMNCEKATGPDKITAALIRIGGRRLAEWLTIQYNKIIQTQEVPEHLKQSVVCMIPKTDNSHPGDTDSRRPISLLNNFLKILECILAERFQDSAQKAGVFGPGQFGFLRGRRIETPVSHLINVLGDAKLKKKKVYMLGLDISKAYDSLDVVALTNSLRELGLEPAFINYVKNLYRGRQARVLTGYGPTAPYDINRGISQGDPLSCLLFIAFIEKILKSVNKNFAGSGYKLSELREILIIAFADDLMLFAENKEDLERIGRHVVRLIEEAGMKINYRKSDFLSNDKDDRSPLQLEKEMVARVPQGQAIRYLGIFVDEDLNMKINSDKLVEKMFKRLTRVYEAHVPLVAAVQLINECVTPCLSYVARHCPLKNQTLDIIEHKYTKIIKELSWKLKRSDPSDIIFLGTEYGGMGVRSVKDEHDKVVITQLIQRIVDKGELGANLRQEIRDLERIWATTEPLMHNPEKHIHRRKIERPGYVQQALQALARRKTTLSWEQLQTNRFDTLSQAGRISIPVFLKDKCNYLETKAISDLRIKNGYVYVDELLVRRPDGCIFLKKYRTRPDNPPEWFRLIQKEICFCIFDEKGRKAPTTLVKERYRHMHRDGNNEVAVTGITLRPFTNSKIGQPPVMLYTDGSSMHAPDGTRRSGVAVIWDKGNSEFEIIRSGRGHCIRETNYEAELEAIFEALMWAAGRDVTIRSDCMSGIQLVERMLKEKEIPLADLVVKPGWTILRKIQDVLKEYRGKVQIIWVKAHQENKCMEARMNNEADKAAKAGTKMEREDKDIKFIEDGVWMRIGEEVHTSDYKASIKKAMAKNRLLALGEKQSTSVLALNARSGAGKTNRNRIVATASLGSFLSRGAMKYITYDKVNKWEKKRQERENEARKKERKPEMKYKKKGNDGKCPMCGAKDSYTHFILHCPFNDATKRKMMKSQEREELIALDKWVKERENIEKDMESEVIRAVSGDDDGSKLRTIGVVDGKEVKMMRDVIFDLYKAARQRINLKKEWKERVKRKETSSPFDEEKEWNSWMNKFKQELLALHERYHQNTSRDRQKETNTERSNGTGTSRKTRKERVENAWATPKDFTTLIKTSFGLHTCLFSHPGNADYSFEENYSPCPEDGFFGAEYDAYSALKDNGRVLLAYANPEYFPQAAMDHFFTSLRTRLLSSAPCRVVMVIPYDEGKANKRPHPSYRVVRCSASHLLFCRCKLLCDWEEIPRHRPLLCRSNLGGEQVCGF